VTAEDPAIIQRRIVMSHRSFRVVFVCLATLAVATPVRAQHVELGRASGAYSALGLGGGNFKLTCDSGCTGNQLTASDLSLLVGRHFGSRLRAEVGAHFQRNTDQSSDVFTGSAGMAFYLVGNLYVRGAATYVRVSVEDTSGTFEGTGGPGFSVGAGYELFLGDRMALTPYVNYASASLSKIDRTVPGGTTVTTAGTVHALNFGVSLGRSSRDYNVCVTAAGERTRLSAANRARYQSCLAEWAAWLERQAEAVRARYPRR
jgi:hypothetical protein